MGVIIAIAAFKYIRRAL
ncbi:hypothetical protein [Pseudomonas aeruginosa]|nr:hypothetical protein [Pseudomonas aeruginosa]